MLNFLRVCFDPVSRCYCRVVRHFSKHASETKRNETADFDGARVYLGRRNVNWLSRGKLSRRDLKSACRCTNLREIERDAQWKLKRFILSVVEQTNSVKNRMLEWQPNDRREREEPRHLDFTIGDLPFCRTGFCPFKSRRTCNIVTGNVCSR